MTSHHTPMQNDVIHSYKEHSLRGQPRNTVFYSGWVVKRQDLIPVNLVRLTYSSQRQTLNLSTAILCDSVHIPIPYLGARSHGMHGHTNGVWVTEAVTSHSWLRWFPNSNPGWLHWNQSHCTTTLTGCRLSGLQYNNMRFGLSSPEWAGRSSMTSVRPR